MQGGTTVKKSSKIMLGIALLIVIIVGIGVKQHMDKKAQLQEELIKIAKSDEAIAIYEKDMKWLDPKAFTEEGIIQSYEVDYDSIELNPMGGFSIHLYINGDSKYRYTLGLQWETPNGGLYAGGWGISDALQKLIRER